MALDTNLSKKPYFDDYDVTKNFYRVLYRPAAAVQARELNQMQTILQDQIDKFGRHIFKEGSVVEGCAFTFDNSYNYVKIKDNYANNSAISNINDLVGKIAVNSANLQARVVNSVSGYESNNINLNTLYVKYLNSANYANGDQQFAFANAETVQILTDTGVGIGNVVVATASDSSGKGYAFTTTEGVIFKKGFFIRVQPQTLIVSKYNNQPDGLSVGFDAVEEIVTPEIDISLLDNAAGSPNYDAPGAHRLKLVPTLVTRESADIANTTTFFSLCDFKNGLPISIKNDAQYAAIGKEMARRTYETNGSYVVNPFLLSTEVLRTSNNASNTTHFNIVSSPGIGYVQGYRAEFINNNTIPVRKGLDFVSVDNQIVSTNFGYYFEVNEFCGDFNNEQLVQVELHNVAKTAITNKDFLGVSYSTSTKIGTAYVRGVSYNTGTPGVDAVYNLYLFNITMSPGFKTSDAKSVIYYSSGVKAVADIVLTYDATLAANTARIQDAKQEIMIYPFGQKALMSNGFSSAEYVYRNRANAYFQANGTATITLGSAAGTGSESFLYSGSYSTNLEESFIMIPITAGYSSSKTGTVSVSTTSSNVVGSGTAFASEYQVGDYFYANTITKRITSITNSSLITVDSVYGFTSSGLAHQKAFPAGAPISFTSPLRTISATSTVARISLGETVNSSFQSSFYFDILRSGTVPIKKSINKGTYIKIQANTNPGGTTGPWCLGIPDVWKLNAVYVDSTGGTYSNSNPNNTSRFRLDTGQRDSYYGLAFISSKQPLAKDATLLVSVDNFTYDISQGVGFFTANSYPVDDANTANATAIQTYNISRYTSSFGDVYDLRDVVDFRPYAVNNAVANASIAGATINPANTLTLYSYSANGSYVPSPDTNFKTNLKYYLPRKDRIVITTGGQLVGVEGISGDNPVTPTEIPSSMTIGTAYVPPYPSLPTTVASSYNRFDYAVQLTLQQTRRYTMADIGKLSQRIDRLEYYTSLSLLEQSTSSLLVRSDNTGQNRFKNGFLVDPFNDHTIGNTRDANYTIAIDSAKSEARPLFELSTLGFKLDRNSTAKVYGDLIMIEHDTVVYQSQSNASKYRNCIEGNVYNYRGTITLNPPGSVTADINKNPDVISNLDQSPNWINMKRNRATAWGSQWGAWTNKTQSFYSNKEYNTYKDVSQNSSDFLSQTTNKSQTVNIQSTVSSSEVDVGSFVSDVSLLPYISPITVFFSAKGMKPNTTLYPYFDRTSVSNVCMPLTPYGGTITRENGIYYSTNGKKVYISSAGFYYEYDGVDAWGSDIVSDSNGNVYGIFSIPKGAFRSGDLEFKLTDIYNLEIGESAVSTQASVLFYGTQLSVQKANALINVRMPQPIIQNIVQQNIVYNIQTTPQPQPVDPPSPLINPTPQPPVTPTVIPDPGPVVCIFPVPVIDPPVEVSWPVVVTPEPVYVWPVAVSDSGWTPPTYEPPQQQLPPIYPPDPAPEPVWPSYGDGGDGGSSADGGTSSSDACSSSSNDCGDAGADGADGDGGGDGAGDGGGDGGGGDGGGGGGDGGGGGGDG